MVKPTISSIARAFALSVALALVAGSAAGCVVRPVRPAVTVKATKAPPPHRHQVVVAGPSPRHVWVPGYHVWKRGRWVWVSGAWKLPPRGKKVWIAPRYERRGGGWLFIAGYWR